MQKTVIVLACLASAGYGRRAKLWESQEVDGATNSLASLLLALNPSGAFNPSTGAQFDRLSPSVPSSNPQMKAVSIVDFDANEVGDTDVSLRIARAGPYVVHKKLVAEMANRRQGNAHVKTRGEVRGGGKKPYQQKGSGRARRGSTRSPLIIGGGKCFGPRNKVNWKQKINKKEGRVAISTALMGALPRMKILKDGFEENFASPKTKDMFEFMKRMGWDSQKKRVCMIIYEKRHDNTFLSARNIPNLNLITTDNVNVYNILQAKDIGITESALEVLKERYMPLGKYTPPGNAGASTDEPPAATDEPAESE